MSLGSILDDDLYFLVLHLYRLVLILVITFELQCTCTHSIICTCHTIMFGLFLSHLWVSARQDSRRHQRADCGTARLHHSSVQRCSMRDRSPRLCHVSELSDWRTLYTIISLYTCIYICVCMCTLYIGVCECSRREVVEGMRGGRGREW